MAMWRALVILGFLSGGFPGARGAESEPASRPGLREIRLVTGATSLAPAETVTVGLLLVPEPGFHTYWRGPGVVGVPTRIEWELPAGFRAGELLWPGPERTRMAAITAYGYRSAVCLLTEITAPAKLEGDASRLVARCSWMACADSCHPGNADLVLTLPHRRTGEPREIDEKASARVAEARSRLPRPAPSHWDMEVVPAGPSTLVLRVDTGAPLPVPPSEIYWFCHDLQVHSDEPQQVRWEGLLPSSFSLRLHRPEFAPAAPERFSGLLFHPGAWPGIGSKWIEVDLPWNESETARTTP